MTKSYTVIAEGERACSKHPPISEEPVTVLTNDIEFRGLLTNQTDTSVSLLGTRNIVKRIRGRHKDVRTPFVLHFRRKDIINLRTGSFTGASVIS